MKIYDISMPIRSGMPVYKNREEKRPVLSVRQNFQSSSVYESSLSLDMHTGTHVDAPLHTLESGGTVEGIPLDKVITPCRVLDFTALDDRIREENLRDRNIQANDFLLFKTRNSYDEVFNPGFVYLDASGAAYLAGLSIKGVGTDALGIERSQPGHPTHKTLLSHGIVILEGLRLAAVPEGTYLLFAAPLLVPGAEAAPARAVLVEG